MYNFAFRDDYKTMIQNPVSISRKQTQPCLGVSIDVVTKKAIQ